MASSAACALAPSGPPAFAVELFYPLKDTAYCEELLVARDDLADLPVEENIAPQELQQAGRRQQTHQQPVLLSGLHWRAPEHVEVGG